MQIERMLTVEQIAEIENVNRETVRRWLQRNEVVYGRRKLNGTKIGRDWFVDPAELERFVKDGGRE